MGRTESAPLIRSAGRNHVILSKQLCIVICECVLWALWSGVLRPAHPRRLAAVAVLCGTFIFFRAEQDAVNRSRLTAAHVTDQNKVLQSTNAQLLETKSRLQEDEDECVWAFGTAAPWPWCLLSAESGRCPHTRPSR